MFQGSCENGPRALGNRSILFDPTFEDGKDFVNEVKHREYFRPFAGTVLEEHVHDWFDLRGMESSPSMMYAVNCKEGKDKLIPSVIHVDGSCRIQTVNAEQNEHFYNLISEFYKETGVPVLFNTSFNLGGEPLVETLDDAIKTLVESDIEYLYMPEYELIISIKN
jgi:carbamoyltransferase